MRNIFKVVFLSAVLFAFGLSTAFAVDFSAEVADVTGQAVIVAKSSGRGVSAVKGMKLFPGDSVETKAGAELELLYEDGSVTRISENSKITIKQLTVEGDKSHQTVLDLALGRVKNAVAKLATSNSKFEVRTKTATAGGSGSSWFVGLSGNLENPMTEVFLMPRKDGRKTKEKIEVKSEGITAPPAILTPGMTTTIKFEKPPEPPAPINPKRLSILEKMLPLKTSPALQKQKSLDFVKKVFTPPTVEIREENQQVAPPAPRDDGDNYILFESIPPGAEVNVDGIYVGNTPVQLPLKDGPHKVMLYLYGYAKWENRVKTFAGFRVSAELKEIKK
jgi:hypothetical protein